MAYFRPFLPPDNSSKNSVLFQERYQLFFLNNPDMTKNTDATHKKSLYHPSIDVITNFMVFFNYSSVVSELSQVSYF